MNSFTFRKLLDLATEGRDALHSLIVSEGDLAPDGSDRDDTVGDMLEELTANEVRLFLNMYLLASPRGVAFLQVLDQEAHKAVPPSEMVELYGAYRGFLDWMHCWSSAIRRERAAPVTSHVK